MPSNTSKAKKINEKVKKQVESGENGISTQSPKIKSTTQKAKASQSRLSNSLPKDSSNKKNGSDKKTRSTVTTKKSTTPKVDDSKETTMKKTTTRKTTVTKTKSGKTSTSKATAKKSSSKTSSSSKKNVSTLARKASSATKKTTKKVATKKEVKISPTKRKIVDESLTKIEYYDLPYRYNETVVKILAQTPKKLFIYWDVSEKDIENYRKIFGENFYNDTYPVLLVHNIDMHYTFEVPVNDLANSWYLDIQDPKCKYEIELGRKFKQNYAHVVNNEAFQENPVDLQNDYLHISTSNTLEAPNNRILFDQMPNHVTYRNVKTHVELIKDITKLPKYKKFGSIVKLYEKIYENDVPGTSETLRNPSSAGNPSSSFFK